MMRVPRPASRKQGGFTLIELLVVVAVIGIIASIMIPSLMSAIQKAKQKRTIADIKLIGNAWMGWLTDEVGAAAAGAPQQFEWDQFTQKTVPEMQSLLIPQYMTEIPTRDGWRQTYGFGIASDLESPIPMAVRSSGSDHEWEGDTYTTGPFPANRFRKDIVWAGGYFVRWPEESKKE